MTGRRHYNENVKSMQVIAENGWELTELLTVMNVTTAVKQYSIWQQKLVSLQQQLLQLPRQLRSHTIVHLETLLGIGHVIRMSVTRLVDWAADTEDFIVDYVTLEFIRRAQEPPVQHRRVQQQSQKSFVNVEVLSKMRHVPIQLLIKLVVMLVEYKIVEHLSQQQRNQRQPQRKLQQLSILIIVKVVVHMIPDAGQQKIHMVV